MRKRLAAILAVHFALVVVFAVMVFTGRYETWVVLTFGADTDNLIAAQVVMMVFLVGMLVSLLWHCGRIGGSASEDKK